MEKIFSCKKIKQTFYLTTSDGRVKANSSKQIPHNTFIQDTLYKGGFIYIYHRQYPVETRVLDFKIKYFGYCIVTKDKKYPFYIYQDGFIRTDGLNQDCINIDFLEYDNVDKIKNFLLDKCLKDERYTIEIYQRSSIIEAQYKEEDEDITSHIYPRWKYFFIEPLIRWSRNRELRKANKKEG